MTNRLVSFSLIFLSSILSSISLGATYSNVQGHGDSLGLSPFWDWRTITTEHFRVTFPAELANEATKSANYLEEAHTLLSKKLLWEPKNRTQVLVIDNADMANGMASPVLRFGMVFYVTPPDNWFSISHYDDWLRLLAIHEYTHFLNMDPTRGLIWEPLRILLGDILLPNSFWPDWMLEGLAVYMETHFTSAGRGRSTFYDMVLRAAIEEGVLDSPNFITLDKINGGNPYYPGGETAYLFGYQLMNRVAGEPGEQDNKLGIMSEQSSYRVPFFINGNLENITGKDWYDFWREWVASVRQHMTTQLDKIKSKPITKVERLTSRGYSALGSAASPDGKLVAYTQDSSDRRSGLYIMELATGHTERIGDKLHGVAMAFTPDSQKLIYSAIHRKSQYYLRSDVAAYDLKSRSTTWLTDGLRAKDPDVARDGNSVVFTITDQATVGIGLATLVIEGDNIALGPVKRIFMPNAFDATATPKFSPDGKRIIFSIHKSGNTAEDLMALDLATGAVSTILANNKKNRFPAFDHKGDLYFVSDLSGIDNIYVLKNSGSPARLTNVTTGLWLPTFAPSGALYASAFSTAGWDLARIDLSSYQPIQTESVAIKPYPAPTRAPADATTATEYPIENYSIFPSIWPRQWLPLLTWSTNGVFAGGEVIGFDAVDRHEYLLGGGYNTEINKLDWIASYFNRSLGPTLSLSAYNQTNSITYSAVDGSIQSFTRKSAYSMSTSFPILWTYSSMMPSLSFNAERESTFNRSTSTKTPISQSRYVPNADIQLSYSNGESSRLAITQERGRSIVIGSRFYFDSEIKNWKLFVADTEHLALPWHTVLVPSLRASWVSQTNPHFTSANVVVSGRSNSLTDSLSGNSLEKLAIRGYPQATYYARSALVTALDYRFPLLRILRGWGTNPLFFENIFGFIFAETAYFPTASIYLPSIGAGIRLSTEILLRVPLIFSLEYHRGFREDFGGMSELFFGLNLSAFEF